MGVLNITPDSFADGGRYTDPSVALTQASQMVADGADIIDVGGESTRPGAAPLSAAAELDRVMPVIERLAAELDVPLSIDTSKADVMREAVGAGAAMINDVRALECDGALSAAADLGVLVCLMHMRGNPRSMQEAPEYENVTDEVIGYLRRRVAACVAAGIEADNLCVDPGFGFGKTLAHNLQLLGALDRFSELGLPLLVGLSRKSMIGLMTGRDVGDRLPGSLALALLAAQRGAAIIRVHDVGPTVDVLQILQSLASSSRK